MTKNSDDGKLQWFSYLQTGDESFWRKKRGKMPFFRIYRPLPYSYSSRARDGENICSLPEVLRRRKYPQKLLLRNLRRLTRVLRLETWDSGCLRGRPSQAPVRAQSPTRNIRIKRRKIRRSFWGYFCKLVYTVPESSRVFIIYIMWYVLTLILTLTLTSLLLLLLLLLFSLPLLLLLLLLLHLLFMVINAWINDKCILNFILKCVCVCVCACYSNNSSV